MGKGQKLYKEAKRLIPGGTQLFSKRPEMILPELWPAYYQKARGCRVRDLDGKWYRDMSYMGIGACVLGYAHPEVDHAVKIAIDNGSMSTLNCPEEVELAKTLIKLHPWANMARFARGGGEAMAIAVRIARAFKGKDKILFCGYHGWHDWYLSANLSTDSALDGHLISGLAPKGVPRALQGSALTFKYNDVQGFLNVFRENKNNLAAVVMEPIRNFEPTKEFLETVRSETKKVGTVLIFDEVSAGWRMALGGAHLALGIEPDMAVFGKAMSNGYPMAAVIGRYDVMEAAQDTFISSTCWTERVGPAAALATIKIMKKNRVAAALVSTGKKVQGGWEKAAKKHGLDISIGGMPPIGHFKFKYPNALVLKTLFAQEMLKKNFLATDAFYASCAHTTKDVSDYLDAVEDVFEIIARAVKNGSAARLLRGPVCHGGFKRLA